MRRIYSDLMEAIRRGERFTFGEVIETKGSTPQKPGAKALFLADGRSSGTLGGGCLEAESRRVALDCLREGTRTVLTLHLDSDFGWDDGLICGGTARVFLDGKPEEHAPLWEAIVEFLRERRRGAFVTVVASEREGWVGSRWLIESVRETECPEDERYETLKILMASPPKLPPLPREVLTWVQEAVIRGGEEATMTITLEGVQTELFAEPLLPRPHLIIAGAGHIGAALAHLGALLEFEVTVVDDRQSLVDRRRIPDADHLLVGDIPATVGAQPMDKDTYIVIVTRGHRHDAQVLREVIRHVERVAYIGMIGSRRKIKLIYDELIAEGLATPGQLAKVHSPLGIDIGGESVWEIVVSIAAELVWTRNGRKGTLRPLREKLVPLILREGAPLRASG